mgnify:CR=1 FL=1
MSCNCKRKIELEEKYGTEELFMSLAVIVPIFLIKIFYMIIFTNNRTVWIPDFLKKTFRT